MLGEDPLQGQQRDKARPQERPPGCWPVPGHSPSLAVAGASPAQVIPHTPAGLAQSPAQIVQVPVSR